MGVGRGGRSLCSPARTWRRSAGTAVATTPPSRLALALLIATPPSIGPSIIDVPATHRALVYQAHLRTDMTRAVQAAGGSTRILACGTVMTEGFQVPMLAWNLGVHTIGSRPRRRSPAPAPPPNVIFQTRAQRNAHLLPIVRAWHSVHYTHVTTFARSTFIPVREWGGALMAPPSKPPSAASRA